MDCAQNAFANSHGVYKCHLDSLHDTQEPRTKNHSLTIKIETQNAAGTTLQSFAYTLDTTGRRTAIAEASGRNTSYSYDSLYRLTADSITGPAPYPVPPECRGSMC